MRPGLRAHRRLERLEVAWRAKLSAQAVVLDPACLTAAEQSELATLAARIGKLPDGRWDFTGIDDAALDRLAVLVGKGDG